MRGERILAARHLIPFGLVRRNVLSCLGNDGRRPVPKIGDEPQGELK
jgi:hypothetical protein